MPGTVSAIDTHRRLWIMSLPGVPRPLWLMIQFWRWLRWVSWSGWVGTFRAVRRFGPDVRRREGLGLGLQMFRILRLALGACVPAQELYRFRLYRKGGRRELWDYVFDQETEAFHRWRDGDRDEAARARELLRDKPKLLDLLGAAGIPVTSTLAIAPRDPADLKRLFGQHPALICKPRRGSRSRGTFMVEADGEGMRVIRLNDDVNSSGQESELILRAAFESEEYLVQPFYVSHPALAGITPSPDAITLRLITEDPRAGPRCYSAVLEIPLGEKSIGLYVLLPVDLESGEILRWPDADLPGPVMENYQQVYDRKQTRQISTVPGWNRLRAAALAAHLMVPELYAVAWDFIIAGQGPLLLEGNSRWGCSTPQRLLGGMLGAASSGRATVRWSKMAGPR